LSSIAQPTNKENEENKIHVNLNLTINFVVSVPQIP
jgi:hypothetical protein